MILIADSGSTKTDWCFCNSNNATTQIKTVGFNPNYYPLSILETLANQAIPTNIENTDISEVFFYGSGCSGKTNIKNVENELQKVFPNAKIEVNHDLLGAARALCGKEAGIACIMGTGSNACYYDGEKIVENIPSLGWIFSDHGGGTHIGKSFIEQWLRKKCPQEIEIAFEKKYDLNFEAVMSNLYQKGVPNKFFSQFSIFVNEQIEHPFVRKIVEDSFNLFFQYNIEPYNLKEKVPIYCTGSIAVAFEEILYKSASDNGFLIKNISKNPADGLIKYHLIL